LSAASAFGGSVRFPATTSPLVTWLLGVIVRDPVVVDHLVPPDASYWLTVTVIVRGLDGLFHDAAASSTV
jgi:hypothetical protein